MTAFRERAAIAIASVGVSQPTQYPSNLSAEIERTMQSSAIFAQQLADVCCKSWGHSRWKNGRFCVRCGVEIKAREPATTLPQLGDRILALLEQPQTTLALRYLFPRASFNRLKTALAQLEERGLVVSKKGPRGSLSWSRV